REGIDADLIEDVFPAEELRKEVRDPRSGEVSSEFYRVTAPVVAKCFGNKKFLLIGRARQDAGAPHVFKHAADAGKHVIGVREAVLVVTRELHTQMARPVWRERAQ